MDNGPYSWHRPRVVRARICRGRGRTRMKPPPWEISRPAPRSTPRPTRRPTRKPTRRPTLKTTPKLTRKPTQKALRKPIRIPTEKTIPKSKTTIGDIKPGESTDNITHSILGGISGLLLIIIAIFICLMFKKRRRYSQDQKREIKPSKKTAGKKSDKVQIEKKKQSTRRKIKPAL